jgi:deoxyhypusine synthase
MDEVIDRAKKEKYLAKPVHQLDLSSTITVADIVDAFAEMSIQARELGRAAKLYEAMLKDQDRPTIFLGLAGPLIAAGLRKVIRDMVATGIVDVIVSTGAIIYQDFYQSRGGNHYLGKPEMDDAELRSLMIDRIYDTLVDEELFEDTDEYIAQFAETLEPRNYSSREFIYELSKRVDDDDSILKAARIAGVPVFVPALNDSSIGIGLTEYYAKHLDTPRLTIDPIRDNFELMEIFCKSKASAAIFIGGGIPKNTINDIAVLGAYVSRRPGWGHRYAIQITTATPLDGGLSGSTLGEAKSWGKVEKEAATSMVFLEASIGLPLLVGYVLGRGLHKNRPKPEFTFGNNKVELLFK